MSKPSSFLAIAVLAVLATTVAACTSGEAKPPVVDKLHEAIVSTIEANKGSDLTDQEIEIVLRGTFVNACSRVSRVNQELIGNTITMEVETARTGKKSCETRQDSTAEFIHVIPIDTEALRAGTYTVRLGNLFAEFEVK